MADYFEINLNLLKTCRVKIWKQEFSIVKSKTVKGPFLAAISDYRENTLIVESDHNNFEPDNIIAVDQGWKVFTFEIEIPVDVPGFLATVSTLLAQAGVPIFVLSTYSSDHLLVKSNHLDISISIFKKAGCILYVE